MSDHKESLLRVFPLKQRIDPPFILFRHPHFVVVVAEAPSDDHDRLFIRRHLADPVRQHFCRPERPLPDQRDVLGNRIRGLFFLFIGRFFIFKSLQAPRKDPVLALSHPVHLFVAQAQHFLQGELLIDGIAAVERRSVRPLNASDPARKIAPERMVLHAAQVIEPHIRGDLELQHRAALLKRLDQRFSLGVAQVRRVESVPDPHIRHLLSRLQRLPDAFQAVGNIIAQAVVLARMNPEHEPRVLLRDPHQFMDHRRDIPDIIELFSDNVAARHVRVRGNALQRLQILPEIVSRLHLVLHDGQRNPADGSQKPQQNSRLLGNGRHDGVYLLQHRRGALFFDKGRVRDLRVAHPLPRVAAGYPQQLVLKERIILVSRILPIPQDLQHSPADVRVRDLRDLVRGGLHEIFRLLPLCKDIPVQIHLLKIRKHGLPVLQNSERPPDPRNIVGGVLRIVQNQISKI